MAGDMPGEEPKEMAQQCRARGRPPSHSHLVVADTPERSQLPQPDLFMASDFISIHPRRGAGNYADIVIRLPQPDVRKEQQGSTAQNQSEL